MDTKSLGTNRIALTQGPVRFDYYADSVWTDRLPLLLQTLMVEAFEADGRIGQVDREAHSLTYRYLLRTDIRQFEADILDPRQVHRILPWCSTFSFQPILKEDGLARG